MGILVQYTSWSIVGRLSLPIPILHRERRFLYGRTSYKTTLPLSRKPCAHCFAAKRKTLLEMMSVFASRSSDRNRLKKSVHVPHPFRRRNVLSVRLYLRSPLWLLLTTLERMRQFGHWSHRCSNVERRFAENCVLCVLNGRRIRGTEFVRDHALPLGIRTSSGCKANRSL